VTKSVFTADYERFRALLVDARRKAGLTQVDIAERLSRPQSFVCKYEQGERRLDVIEFIQVANALGIDPAKFIRTLTSGR
jgi:transcriptional regulator with XRE-family HTH domain